MALQQPANKVFLNGKPFTSWAEELSQPEPKVIASSVTVTHDIELPEDDETTTSYIAKLIINFDDSGIDLNYQEKVKEATSKWGLSSILTIPSKVLAIKLAELILDYYGC